MADLIQLRGDTAANWATADPILRDREPGYDKTNHQIRVGDGVSHWSALPAIGGGGSGGVTSVNGHSGIVVLSATDVGAVPSSGGIVTGELTANGFYNPGVPGAESVNGVQSLFLAKGVAASPNTGGFTFKRADSTWGVSSPYGSGQPFEVLSPSATIASDTSADRAGIGAGGPNPVLLRLDQYGGIGTTQGMHIAPGLRNTYGGGSPIGLWVQLGTGADVPGVVVSAAASGAGAVQPLFLAESYTGTPLSGIDAGGNLTTWASDGSTPAAGMYPGDTGLIGYRAILNAINSSVSPLALHAASGQVGNLLTLLSASGANILGGFNAQGSAFTVADDGATIASIMNAGSTPTGNQRLSLAAITATTVPLKLYLAASQSANAMEVRNSAGTARSAILSEGSFVTLDDSGAGFMVGLSAGTTPSGGTRATFAAGSAGIVPLRLYTAAGQTANALGVMDSTNKLRSAFYSDGSLITYGDDGTTTASFLSSGSAPAGGSRLALAALNAGIAPLKVYLAASQTADALDVINSASVTVAKIDPSGAVYGSALYDNGNRAYSLSNPPPGGVALASTAPVALASVAAVGTGSTAARNDHVHPTTGLALLTASQTITGQTTLKPSGAGNTPLTIQELSVPTIDQFVLLTSGSTQVAGIGADGTWWTGDASGSHVITLQGSSSPGGNQRAIFNAGIATVVPININLANSQSADALDIRNGSNVVFWSVTASGGINQTLQAASAVGQVINLAASQSGDAMQVKSSGGTTLFKINSAGDAILRADPSTALGAATKQYIDNKYIPIPTVVAVSTTHTMALWEVAECDATAAAFNVSPPASPVSGDMIWLKKVDSTANAITFVGTVDSTVNPTITYQWGSLWLMYDGSKWIRPDRHTLGALVDVSLGTPSDGQSLLYNAATKMWVPGTPALSNSELAYAENVTGTATTATATTGAAGTAVDITGCSISVAAHAGVVWLRGKVDFAQQAAGTGTGLAQLYIIETTSGGSSLIGFNTWTLPARSASASGDCRVDLRLPSVASTRTFKLQMQAVSVSGAVTIATNNLTYASSYLGAYAAS